MKLSDNKQEFQELITLTARWRKIPEDAVRKDYFIIVMLRQLEESKYADCCTAAIRLSYDPAGAKSSIIPLNLSF